MGYITEILISSNRIDQKNLFTMRNSFDDILVGKRSNNLDRCRTRMVGPVRFELTTPRLSSVCSNQLSYEPVLVITGK